VTRFGRLLTLAKPPCGVAVAAAAWCLALAPVCIAQPAGTARQRCFVVEIYPGVQNNASAPPESLVNQVAARPGVTARGVDVASSPANRERRQRICDYFRIQPSPQPIIYGCGQAVVAAGDAQALRNQLDQMFTLTAFVREGCPHCADAKRLLKELPSQYAGLRIVYRDMLRDRSSGAELETLTARYQKRAVSLPVLHFCNTLQVGYDTHATSGRAIEQTLRRWSAECPDKPSSAPPAPSRPAARPLASLGRSEKRAVQASVFFASMIAVPRLSASEKSPGRAALAVSASDLEELPLPPLTTDEESPLPLPSDAPKTEHSPAPVTSEQAEIDLPVFGRVNVEGLGLPLFTIAVGLVDGFNPCAMWVLLFLLSILVNLHDRWKILAVAGTFVIISGLAYFAFMAAWLNVFRLVGLLRPAQIALGAIAVFIGAVHVKDFFAFKRGVSFSIPEAAKPGIYARVRRIVTAERMLGAVLGAAVLAVLVNVVELLCTAGLPALYTQILSMRQFPLWKDYLYLGLYNLAYMFDDGLMVGIVVATLGKHKLQEREGRWLKLLSGLVILLLGALMLLKPEWLV
jgi:glutaredoxin